MTAVLVFLVLALIWALESRHRWKRHAEEQARWLHDFARRMGQDAVDRANQRAALRSRMTKPGDEIAARAAAYRKPE